MAKSVQIKNGLTLQLEDKAFAGGGEGDLYRITAPDAYRTQVVKIYKPEKRTKEREHKITYLIANPPVVYSSKEHQSLVWMSEAVYEHGKFAGFLMPVAEGEKLELLCHAHLPKKLGNEWGKFSFASPEGLKLRQKICFNIAVAIYHVHRLGKYILVDMKPENIMIQSNGLISIIDIDSVAVVDGDRLLYAGPVVTPDYTPPEYYHPTKGKKTVEESWDRFSMAIIFYRLLCGIHPFTGSCHPPYDKCNGIAEMIEHNLFANGHNRRHFKVVPPPHNNLKKLPPNVQELFDKCFADGHKAPRERPTADEWCTALVPPEMRVLSRPLPSSRLALPSYQFSKALPFAPAIELPFPEVTYVGRRANVLGHIINNLLGRSEKQKMGDRVSKEEQMMKKRMAQQSIFEKELANIIADFRHSQTDILSAEQTALQRLQSNINKAVAALDAQSKELCGREIQEIKTITTAANNSIAEIEKLINQAYKNIIAVNEEQLRNARQKIQSDIDRLQEQVKTESKTMITAPGKLGRHHIGGADIFPAAAISNLSAHGFNTAADFMDVDAEGRLKDRHHQWVKVPGIAKVRGAQLNDWRKSLEIKEDAAILAAINAQYSGKASALHAQLRESEREYNSKMKAFQATYNLEKEKLDAEKKQYKSQLRQQERDINAQHDQLQAKLFEEAAKVLSRYVPETVSIAGATRQALDKNLQEHRLVFSQKMEEADHFIAALHIDISSLQALQHQYLQLR